MPEGTHLGSKHASINGHTTSIVPKWTANVTVSVPLCLPLANGKGAFAPRLELLDEVLSHCDMGCLIQLAQMSEFNHIVVQHYIYLRKRALANHFFDDPDSFYDMLSDSRTIFSGSAAVQLLLPVANTAWTADDMDLYVPTSEYRAVQRWLVEHQFLPTRNDKQLFATYDHRDISFIALFTDGQRKIVVVISKTEAACAPIFSFDSTAAMNFVGGKSIFCAYPHLTLEYLSMINPGSAYCGGVKIKQMDALRKYSSRGFSYIPWPTNKIGAHDAPYRSRSITDTFSMLIDTEDIASEAKTYQEMLRKFKIMDVEWCLGGTVDGPSNAFALPRVTVIDDST